MPSIPDWAEAAEAMVAQMKAAKKVTPSKESRAKYPWEIWTDGEWHDAQRGVDFTCTMSSFRSYLYNYAMDHGMEVQTMLVSRKEQTLSFTFWKDE